MDYQTEAAETAFYADVWQGTKAAGLLTEEAKRAAAKARGEREREKRKAESAFKFISVGALECKEPDFLVDELIEADSFGVIFGPPGCGKSFVAVDIALSVATGTDFHGRPTRQGMVCCQPAWKRAPRSAWKRDPSGGWVRWA